MDSASIRDHFNNRLQVACTRLRNAPGYKQLEEELTGIIAIESFVSQYMHPGQMKAANEQITEAYREGRAHLEDS